MDNELMSSTHYYLVSFSSTHHALAAEKALKTRDIPQIMLPTPREISSSCGLALKISCESVEMAVDALKASKVSDFAVYEINYQQHPHLRRIDL